MSNTLKTILKITIIITLFCFIYKSLNANEHSEYKELEVLKVPLYCGETSFVFTTSLNIFDETPVMAGEVRYGAMPDGELLGILSFGYNELTNRGTLFMTLPTSGQTCLLGYGLNWTFFNDTIMGKKILDEDDESK
tara:strand:- start:33 stop:440 length:408 start_codon:yes stop_codon:yes gene_type:complete